jgi:hypothetical protein
MLCMAATGALRRVLGVILGGAILLSLERATQAVIVQWDPNPEIDIAGYRVFWGETNAPAAVRSVGKVTQTELTNLVAGRIYYFYLTALNVAGLESDPSETVLYTQPDSIPTAPSNLTGALDSPTQITIRWSDNSTNESGFRVSRKAGASGTYATIPLGANVTSYTDANLTPATQYFYKVHAYNSAGSSADSAEISVTTPTPPPLSGGARFLAADVDSGGSWKVNYGRDGYVIVGDGQRLPTYASVTASGQDQWIWNWSTDDTAAVERAGSASRLAACWYAASSYQVDVPLSGAGPYRLSVYCLDWDMLGRAQRLEILDRSTGQILNSQMISNFADGVYLTWEITKPITLRVTALSGPNAVLSGIFFDSAAAVLAPEFSPNGGTFTNAITVAISTPTAGATIHYTMDGSLPTASSPIYVSPLTFTNTTAISARAFKDGMAESIVRSATFTRVDGSQRVRFIASNSTRGGTWKGIVGLDGQIVAYETPGLPSSASISFSGANTWVWSFPTMSPAALERPYQNERIATTWYGSSISANVTLRDTAAHRVSLYCVDFDNAGRSQRVEIVDPTTGALLDSTEISGFSGGLWLEYEITGSFVVKLTQGAGPNAVLSGMFFDRP